MNLSISKMPFHVPFYIFDITNFQLITSTTIPSDIKDVKNVVYTEVPIPGMNYQPVMVGGGGNRKISFTLPLIKRNNTVGNVLMLKQFDMLRNQPLNLLSLMSAQFSPFPKVLFNWGIGSIPMIYFVAKADATHKQGWVNEFGMPQYSEIEMELWLDEDNLLYKAEQIFRTLAAYTGMVMGIIDQIQSQRKNEKPY